MAYGPTVTVPFGPDKGKKFTDCSEQELSKLKQWATAKDAAKFSDLIDGIEKELASRAKQDAAPKPNTTSNQTQAKPAISRYTLAELMVLYKACAACVKESELTAPQAAAAATLFIAAERNGLRAGATLAQVKKELDLDEMGPDGLPF